ncbi:MAG: propionyl-CoA synthetase [Actinomycetales bacterium]
MTETASARTYRDLYQLSQRDPEAFWGEAAQAIHWFRAPTVVLDRDQDPTARWFPDGVLNTCFNALDRHVIDGRGDQPALVYDSPVTSTTRTLTYAQLLEQVAACAGVLRDLGVEKGDRVVIYLPMIPEAVVSMLACARIGAIHSVVFGGFAAAELAARIDDATPKVVITATCGIEPGRIVEYKPLLERALELATHQPDATLLVQRPELTCELGPRDVDYRTALRLAEPAACVPVGATDPLYILYTSGTTGRPKGIVRDNGGHAVALRWSMSAVFGIAPGDVWWAASDVGWVVGHSYIVYAPLLTGATTVLYEGKPVGTPDAGAFWRVVAEHQVQGLFTAPTALRAIRKEDNEGQLLRQHDLSSLRALFLAGERLDPDTFRWASDLLDRPVVDNWWQTETGWPICAVPQGLPGGEQLPLKAGSPGVPMPGWELKVLDERGQQVPPQVEGAICLQLPLAPGASPTLWGDDERYVASYLSAFDGYYLSGDGGYVDEDGYVYVLGRTDDVINVAGHRLSTGSLEAALAGHPAVAEVAVIGVHDELKGQVPRALVVLKAGVDAEPDALAADLVLRVREQVGPVAALKQVDIVPALPKTRSGKILRRTMREIADGRSPAVPSTIEDPTVLDRLRDTLRPLPSEGA